MEVNQLEKTKTVHQMMEWRFACKRFDGKAIPEAELNEILGSARLSPSSFGIQAWKFVVITNQDLKAKLAPVCYNQPQITEASALVFLCARMDLLGEQGVIQRHIDNFKAINHKTDQEAEGYKSMLVGNAEKMGEAGILTWTQKQTYIASETLIMAAAEKGIDSCPMEGFDPEGVAKVLELPAHIKPTVLVSLGYRKMEAPTKVRFPMSEIVDFRK